MTPNNSPTLHKVAELEGVLLDAAVTRVMGHGISLDIEGALARCIADGVPFSPSTNWSHGGPLIEREQIELTVESYGPGHTLWLAEIHQPSQIFNRDRAFSAGSTPLIAAMRAYVKSQSGAIIDLL